MEANVLATAVYVGAGLVASMGGLYLPRIQARFKRAGEQQVLATKALSALEGKCSDLLQRLRLYCKHCPEQIEQIRRGSLTQAGPFIAPMWYSPFDCGLPDRHIETHSHNLEVETARLALARDAVPALQSLESSRSTSDLGAAVVVLSAAALAHPYAESVPGQIERVIKAADNALAELMTLDTRAADREGRPLLALMGTVTLGCVLLPLLTPVPMDRLALTAVVVAVAVCVATCVQSFRLSRLSRYKTLLPPVPVLDSEH